jgi:hypothetical protein
MSAIGEQWEELSRYLVGESILRAGRITLGPT